MTTYADPNDPAETQWLYDEPTGLLTNKLYDDGNGVSYAYYPNGKLHTRTWARGITMTNTYTIFGELETTTYSDGTPAIARQYNRLGQPIIITDAQGTRTYEYSTNTFALLSETILGTLSSSSAINIISYSYNSQRRQTAYCFSSVASGVDRRNLAVTQVTFDDYGRHSTLTVTTGATTNDQRTTTYGFTCYRPN